MAKLPYVKPPDVSDVPVLSEAPRWTHGVTAAVGSWLVVTQPLEPLGRDAPPTVRWKWSGDGRRLLYTLGELGVVRAGGEPASGRGVEPTLFWLDPRTGDEGAVVSGRYRREAHLTHDGRALLTLHGHFDDGGEMRMPEGFLHCLVRLYDLDEGALLASFVERDRIPTHALLDTDGTVLSWGRAPSGADHHWPPDHDITTPRRWSVQTGRFESCPGARPPAVTAWATQRDAPGGEAQAWSEGDGRADPLVLVVRHQGTERRRTLHRDDVKGSEALFDPAGERLLVRYRHSCRYQLFDASDGALLEDVAEDALGFAPDGALLTYTTEARGTLVRSAHGELRVRLQGTDPVLSPGARFVGPGRCEGPHVHSVETGEPVRRFEGGGCIAIAPDGSRIIARAATLDDAPRLHGGERPVSLEVPGRLPGIGKFAFSADGLRIYGSESHEHEARAFDGVSGEPLYSFRPPGPGRSGPWGMPAFAAAAARVAVVYGHSGARAVVFDPSDGSIVGRVALGHSPRSLALSPTADRLVVAYGGGAVVLHWLTRQA